VESYRGKVKKKEKILLFFLISHCTSFKEAY